MVRRRIPYAPSIYGNTAITGDLSVSGAVTATSESFFSGGLVLPNSWSRLVATGGNPVQICAGFSGGTKAASFQNQAGTEKAYFKITGDLGFADSGDSTGSPGAATINAPVGKSAIAAGASSVVITNSLVTTASRVFITPLDNDATLLRAKVAEGSGSFTVTGNANATATWKFNWVVFQTG